MMICQNCGDDVNHRRSMEFLETDEFRLLLPDKIVVVREMWCHRCINAGLPSDKRPNAQHRKHYEIVDRTSDVSTDDTEADPDETGIRSGKGSGLFSTVLWGDK